MNSAFYRDAIRPLDYDPDDEFVTEEDHTFTDGAYMLEWLVYSLIEGDYIEADYSPDLEDCLAAADKCICELKRDRLFMTLSNATVMALRELLRDRMALTMILTECYKHGWMAGAWNFDGCRPEWGLDTRMINGLLWHVKLRALARAKVPLRFKKQDDRFVWN